MACINSIEEVNICEDEKIDFDNPMVILGFVGPGLVGGIAITHLIDQMKMKEIAHIRSKHLPSAVVFIDGKLRHPFRIYTNEKKNLIAVVCEVSIPSEGHYPIASSLLNWIESKNAKELIVLEGIAVRGIPKKRESYCVAEQQKIQECQKMGIKVLSAGIIHGIVGSILNECLIRKIEGIAFMTPAVTFIPDPEGAALLVEVLNKVYGFNVNTDQLLGSAQELKQKLMEIAKNHKNMVKSEEKKGVPERLYS